MSTIPLIIFLVRRLLWASQQVTLREVIDLGVSGSSILHADPGNLQCLEKQGIQILIQKIRRLLITLVSQSLYKKKKMVRQILSLQSFEMMKMTNLRVKKRRYQISNKKRTTMRFSHWV
jgi:hypothetical protein